MPRSWKLGRGNTYYVEERGYKNVTTLRTEVASQSLWSLDTVPIHYAQCELGAQVRLKLRWE